MKTGQAYMDILAEIKQWGEMQETLEDMLHDAITHGVNKEMVDRATDELTMINAEIDRLAQSLHE